MHYWSKQRNKYFIVKSFFLTSKWISTFFESDPQFNSASSWNIYYILCSKVPSGRVSTNPAFNVDRILQKDSSDPDQRYINSLIGGLNQEQKILISPSLEQGKALKEILKKKKNVIIYSRDYSVGGNGKPWFQKLLHGGNIWKRRKGWAHKETGDKNP